MTEKTEAPERIITNASGTIIIQPPAIPLHSTDVEYIHIDHYKAAVAREEKLRDIVEFVRDLSPRVSYPPDDVDDDPHVVIPASTWEAIVDDASAALSEKGPNQ